MSTSIIRRSRRNRVFLPSAFGQGGRLSGLNPFLNSVRRARSARMARSRTRTTNRTRTQGNVSGIGVTTQRDSRFVYAKRRMPRYRRNRWKRFGRKVNAIAEKELGSRTVVRNFTTSAINPTDGDHVLTHCYLYPQRGTTNIADDLFIVSGLENQLDPSAALGDTLSPSTKVIFQSAIMDVTIKNASGVRDDTSPNIIMPSGELKMEVDVYEITLNTSTEETGVTHPSLISLFLDNSTRTAPIGGAGTELSITQRGVTPWDMTYSLSRWGIRIWKKTKYLIPNGDVITYQMRDPRRHVTTLRDLGARDGFNRPGWTKCLLIVGKVIPGYTVGTDGSEVAERLLVGTTRKYLYKVEGVNEDRTRYI